jgi:peptide/nickel transport system substrate-binding protein
MFSIRDLLWDYPAGVIFFVRKFQLVFTIFMMVTLGALAVVLTVSLANNKIQSKLHDGTLKIGVMGSFSVINPLDVSASEPEKLMKTLLFNSLVTIDSSGQIYPELAETWEISPDGKTYTFFLKKNIKWHDGVELTSQDVLTTFTLLQSGDKDTVQGNIAKDLVVTPSGVYEVSFKLPQVNAAFLELMETPILPAHVYREFTLARLAEQGDTFLPIGTGPYSYKQKKGNVVTFTRNKDYFKGTPSIPTLTVTFFEKYEKARNSIYSGAIHLLYPIDSVYMKDFESSVAFSNTLKLASIQRTNNVRVLIVNIRPTAENQHGIQVDQVDFRQTLAQSIDRSAIISAVAGSTPAFGPYDATSAIYSTKVETSLPFDNTAVAKKLEKLGWLYPYSGALFRMKGDTELSLAITFLDTVVNREVASILRKQLAEAGINASLRGVTSETLQQQVLPDKDFELLLFEIQTGIDPDQYGLWHSSQTVFPGLNLGSFSSASIDGLLEKGRLQTNRDKRWEIYSTFQEELVKQAPAVFLYHPAYFEVYFDIIDRKTTSSTIEPNYRFRNIHEWKLFAR